ncbi:28261_t:CDS:2, partial [Racocetra persica]
LTPNTTKCTNFTYTESTNNTQLQPYAIDIQFYDDGTTLIHLVRNNNSEHCFDSILRIRIIHLNLSVTEINVTEIDNLKLDPVNYCLFYNKITGKIVNPISIRPLRQQFILVSYLKNGEEWGAVLNWKGESLSDVNGNLSVLINNTIRIIGFEDITLFTSLATVDE